MKILPGADVNQYRDPSQATYRVRGLGTLSLKWDLSNSSSQGWGNLEEEWAESVRVTEDGGHQDNKLL